jgi:hypothetical protein
VPPVFPTQSVKRNFHSCYPVIDFPAESRQMATPGIFVLS